MVDIKKIKNVKGTINFLIKKTWLLALIGAIVAIVGIFTPAATINYQDSGIDAHIWLGGIIYLTKEYRIPGPGQKTRPSGWNAEGGDAIGIYALVLITVSAAYLILYSILTKKGKEFKRLWGLYLSTGIVMIVVFIFWLIDLSSAITDIKMIGFGSIAPFIAEMSAIVAGILEKKGRV